MNALERVAYADAVLGDAELAKAVLHGKAWRHAFWPRPMAPSKPPGGNAFDFIDALHPHRLRHLPTDRNREAAIKRFGPSVAPLMQEWRRIWDQAVRVEDFELDRKRRLLDAVAKLSEGEAPPEGFPSRSDMQRAARWLAENGRRGEAARLFADAEAWDADPRNKGPVRDLAQHVLEDASTLVALVREGIPFTAITPGYAPGIFLHRGRGHEFREVGEGDAELRELDELWHGSLRAHNPYWTCQPFLDAAGRSMAVARNRDEFVLTLMDMRAQGHGKAFLKAERSKGGTWVIDMTGIVDLAEMDLRLHATLGRAYMSTGPVLIQEFVPFRAEHRFFVVGDRVVASTASDRRLSLTDALGRVLDPRVAVLDRPARNQGAYDRGSARAPEDRPMVASMAAGARRLARALRDEGRIGDCYVIDMGATLRSQADPQPEILPIEINTILHAGLYAVNLDPVFRALARRASAGGRMPEGHVREAPLHGSPPPWRRETGPASIAEALVGAVAQRRLGEPDGTGTALDILNETVAYLEGVVDKAKASGP